MPELPITIYTAPGWLFCEQAKAWLSEAGMRYAEIDTGADAARVEGMIQKAQGTWIFPATVMGEAVGFGFDPE